MCTLLSEFLCEVCGCTPCWTSVCHTERILSFTLLVDLGTDCSLRRRESTELTTAPGIKLMISGCGLSFVFVISEFTLRLLLH